ncbi:hypothetical protein GU3_15830 [Oceanimonas sp. GK1]|uniref:DUF3461 family protein n=1 Tax=Oceanimonas sp. (strain GK1 / IBRC-M 10197) TaxID=511062 RepID=UPI000249554B|nr:DUF3461 family protein [Oceanimonas sp. GK1]AEY02917.1 hypothetical protein GU3_15830 [Oceanimonas sp. GK1]
MSQAYPTLAAMGIEDTGAISRFRLGESDTHKVLKIWFERGPDSCLPASLKFHFPRVINREVAQTLDSAIEELEQLLGRESSRERLLLELGRFERVMNDKMAELRRRMSRLAG